MDDLVNDWTPEPLVASQTSFEASELEKRPVVVGYVQCDIRTREKTHPL